MPASKQLTENEIQIATRLARLGIRFEDIAKAMDMTVDTLRKYAGKEMSAAKVKANSEVAQALFNKALKGDTTCMIFWLKTQARFQEVQKHEISAEVMRVPQPVYNSPDKLPPTPEFLKEIEREIDSELH